VNLCAGGTIAGPGWTFEAIPTPGHTSNHLCYALAEENALFSGDHIMGWSTTVIVPPDGDMAAYYESLRTIRARNFQTLWPTHGPPVTDPTPFIDAYLAHRLAREDQIIALLREGKTTIGEMVPIIYAAVDPRLYPAASRSMLAHLIRMTREGIVSTEGQAEADSRYQAR
jgi:glyoxylase-like metal-dependent hydrolase (beta-lactamase superfamily II)